MTASGRSLPWLRDKLRQGHPLPKDKWVEKVHGNGEIHSFHWRDQRFERRTLLALTDLTARRSEKNSAMRIALCLPSHRCGSTACYYCKHLYWTKVRAKAAAASAGLRRCEMSFLTIIFGAAYLGIPQAEQMIDDALPVLARALRWKCGIKLIGRVELDYLLRGHTLKRDKRRTFATLGAPTEGDVPLLVPHLHALVFHSRIERRLLRLKLSRHFPGYKRVNLKCLHADKTIEENLDRLVRYPLKFLPPDHGQGTATSAELRFGLRANEELGGLHGKLHVEFGV
ncbi:hypothetical protein ACM64Y_19380 [Novispirillum sp. DQ9]|uniref:hypothetical protein n=1 Tax=Novispirillum sp. DQ9 TaxID=3398612 RepID=UPI003C79FECD